MPPIALLTDFGLSDPYVGIMKGVIVSCAPGVPILDITHSVGPQDVRQGALLLDAAWRWFPEGTVFVCVVDPGVGTARRAVVVASADRLFVGPDNGLFGLLPAPVTREITAPWGLAARSRTFHGRDLFAPVAARLATGAPFREVGPLVSDPVPTALPEPDADGGEVIWIDHYGNCITNLPPRDSGAVEVGEQVLPVHQAYGDVSEGAALALTGSTDRLEVAVRGGSAARELGIGLGTRVRWRP
jgi:S-adenosylmethionine hydrolase